MFLLRKLFDQPGYYEQEFRMATIYFYYNSPSFNVSCLNFYLDLCKWFKDKKPNHIFNLDFYVVKRDNRNAVEKPYGLTYRNN